MRRTMVLLLLLILCSLLPMGRTCPAAAASSAEAKVGQGIENLELTGAAESFNIAGDTKLYGWARLKDVAPGSSVIMAFKKGDKEVYRKEISIPSVPYRIHTYRTFRAGDSGEWTFIVAGADGKELGSTTFKVEITK